MNKWTNFYFESNSVWGKCRTIEDWNKVKSIWLEANQGGDILTARQATYGHKGDKSKFPVNFGFRIEHTGNYALADFALDNDVEL